MFTTFTFTLSLFGLVSGQTLTCPSGYVLHNESQKCFGLKDEDVFMMGCQFDVCFADGGGLACIESEAERTWLAANVLNTFTTSLYPTSVGFAWTGRYARRDTGSPGDYSTDERTWGQCATNLSDPTMSSPPLSAWYPGFPFADTSLNCSLIMGHTGNPTAFGLLLDQNCRQRSGCLCMVPASGAAATLPGVRYSRDWTDFLYSMGFIVDLVPQSQDAEAPALGFVLGVSVLVAAVPLLMLGGLALWVRAMKKLNPEGMHKNVQRMADAHTSHGDSRRLSLISDLKAKGTEMRVRVSGVCMAVGWFLLVMALLPFLIYDEREQVPGIGSYGGTFLLALGPPGGVLLGISLQPRDEVLIRLSNVLVGIVGVVLMIYHVVAITSGEYELTDYDGARAAGATLTTERNRTLLVLYICNVVAFAMGLVVLLPVFQPRRHRDIFHKSRWEKTPREALNLMWIALRLGLFLVAVGYTIFVVFNRAEVLDGNWANFERSSGGTEAYALVASLYLSALLPTPVNRRYVISLLGEVTVRQHSRKEMKRAACVASMVGNRRASEVLSISKSAFKVIPYSKLSPADFESNADTGLFEKTQHVELGKCDAFISHSWRDDPVEKWARIVAWAKEFEEEHSREPLYWLDKACIDQQDIDDSLACLPVFLSGCQTLFAVVGPTYTRRLWCVMELFTFLQMGGEADRVAVKLIGASKSLTDDLRDFHAEHAECYKIEDRQKLLGIIETGFGSFNRFNEAVNRLFDVKKALTRMSQAVGRASEAIRTSMAGPKKLEDKKSKLFSSDKVEAEAADRDVTVTVDLATSC